MKRILFYYAGLTNTNLALGGSSRATLNFAIALKHLVPELTVALTSEQITNEESLNGVQFYPLPPEHQIQDFLDSYDCIFFAQHIGVFKNCYKMQKQKWIMDLHCWDMEDVELRKLSYLDSVCARSDIHLAHLAECGIDRNKLKVIPNIIDTSHFYARNVTRNNYALMFAGAIVPHKGVHILLQSFMQLKEKYPELVLDLYGSASMWRSDLSYENTLINLNLPDVHFHGSAGYAEMPEIYSAHNIICLPSEMESFGLVTIEAQACGCIPVVHNVGGTGATLIDGESGLLYKPNDHQTLSIAIEKVLLNSSHFRQNTIRYATENFNSLKSAHLLAELIN